MSYGFVVIVDGVSVVHLMGQIVPLRLSGLPESHSEKCEEHYKQAGNGVACLPQSGIGRLRGFSLTRPLLFVNELEVFFS